MVLATFTHYVMNLFGGGGTLEVPHNKAAAHQSEKVAETSNSVRDAPVSKKVATILEGDGERVPPAEESTDESGTESAAACPESSSSPSKRKRADGDDKGGSKQSEKESDDDDSDDGEDSVLSTAPADSAAEVPAKDDTTATPANPASGNATRAVSTTAASQATKAGDDSRMAKKPRQAAPIASS
jgi:hypothetical protein